MRTNKIEFRPAYGGRGRCWSSASSRCLPTAKRDKRPSFIGAADPELAIPLYEMFLDECRARGFAPEHGQFGADMLVASENDGPVTILLDTDELM